jgi:hypothetical protein
LLVGLVAAALSLLGAFDPAAFFRAYLSAYIFWIGISLGTMAVVMMYHLTGGRWGRLIQRPGEAASLTLPLMLLLFAPIALGLRHLYPWANPTEVAADPVLQHKAIFFNPPAFLLRAIVSLGLWSLWALWIRGLSVAYDREPQPRYLSRLSGVSAAGLVLYFFTMSSAGIDWLMSRDTHWYSSVYGIVIVVGQGLSGVVFLLLALWALRKRSPMAAAVTPERLNDLGNLLLMFVILWAYVSFAQLLVSWMGNKQDEAAWYLQRLARGWKIVSIALIVLHFFVPFLLLLGQHNKRRIEALGTLAAVLLALRWIDAMYLVAPSGPDGPHGLSWLDPVTLIAIGGFWIATFLWNLHRQPLLPRATEIPEQGIAHGEHPDIAAA